MIQARPLAAREDRFFLLPVALATRAFAWLLWPLSGAIRWSIVLAILLAPLQR